jgi:hypothetical protein
MEEKIDLKKFSLKKNKKGYDVELRMSFKSKYFFISFFVSVLLLLESLFSMFNGKIDIVMIVFDLFLSLFLLIGHILLCIFVYSKETIKIDSKKLVIVKKFFLFSNEKAYELSKISNMKIDKKIYGNNKNDRLKKVIDFVTLNYGVLRFNYDSKEVSFGLCLEDYEGEYFLKNHLNNYLGLSLSE